MQKANVSVNITTDQLPLKLISSEPIKEVLEVNSQHRSIEIMRNCASLFKLSDKESTDGRPIRLPATCNNSRAWL